MEPWEDIPFEREMDSFDYWRLSDELSVTNATLLILGIAPEEEPYILEYEIHKRPKHFEAIFAAVTNAINSGRLPARVYKQTQVVWDSTENEPVEYEPDEPNWEKTLVKVDDLKDWLRSRGFTTGFFFPDNTETPDYLDTDHSNYAPKLAAAIYAWQKVSSEPKLLSGTTVKQALLKWLRQNADRFGLTKDDGNPNEQGISEIAKIANWDSKGGAPKTPI